MLESPTFDESVLQRNNTIYRKGQVKIDPNKAAQIPDMKELWEEIQKLSRIVDENTGKIEKTSETPNLTERQLYFMKH